MSEQATDHAGLIDFEPTNSSLYIDIDNDSDLDLINFSPTGKIKTYLNIGSENQHIQIQLNDFVGNRRGIGSKIVIHYGDGLQQMREIKGSGRYFSQDVAIAHFGLAQFSEVSEIEGRWSTGESVLYPGPFYATHRYLISRQ